MADGTLNYPPEILDAVATMQRAARALEQEMADLRMVVDGLVGSSSGAAVQALNEAQELLNRSGLTHNETLLAMATVAGDSYDEITSFDTYMANRLR